VSEKKPFIADAGNAAFLAGFVAALVFWRTLNGFLDARVQVTVVLQIGLGLALTMTLVGVLVAALGLAGRVPNPSRGKAILALVLNGLGVGFTSLVGLAMWTFTQPAKVDVLPTSAALVPGLVPAAEETSILDATAGERITVAKGTMLTVRWEGPAEVPLEADRAEVFRALFAEVLKGDVTDCSGGGHPAVCADLKVDGHKGRVANWQCPASRRSFTILTLSEDGAEATRVFGEALPLVACHGHGQVAFPEARWTPPPDWTDEGVNAGIHWFAGPDQQLGIAAASMADPQTFLADCPIDLGKALEIELQAVGWRTTSTRPLDSGCGSLIQMSDPEGAPKTGRVQVRLCDSFALRLFHVLDEGAVAHDPVGVTCVAVAEAL